MYLAATLIDTAGGGEPLVCTRRGEGLTMAELREFPQCQKCNGGRLVPLSDYGRDGAPITFKAWVCTSPDCGFNIRIDNGEISFGRSISQSHK
jgi:hypothetical protein